MHVIITVKFTNGCEEKFILPIQSSNFYGSHVKWHNSKDFMEFDTTEEKQIRIPFTNVMYYTVQKIKD